MQREHHPLAAVAAAAHQAQQQQQQQHSTLAAAQTLAAAASLPMQQQQTTNTALAAPVQGHQAELALRLQQMNEETYVRIGALADSMGDKDRALAAFDSALRYNPFSVQALTHASSLCRQKEMYPKAIEYFQRLLNIDRYNGAVWAALGHCFLMTDDLQNAYQTYQQALNCLTNPKDPKLWYGIGVLYDRYGSYDHAEAAFASVLRIDPKFDKGNEIYFRLGIIYKHQQKYHLSIDCFKYILPCPPKPLSECDVWFQIGHVHEFMRDYASARSAYDTGLQRSPSSVKILQQLGWLCMQAQPGFQNYDQAIAYLTRALDIDTNDAQLYYLLGRCNMAKQKFNQAYDFYQQAVLRDAKNPIFWCSIGVLYFELGQHRDALDA
ncbi:glucose repression mediator protein, partial [Podochytrium sp. JEL0797]